MIRLQFQLELVYAVQPPGADFFFAIHPALTAYQSVVDECLSVSQPQAQWVLEPSSQHLGQRCLRLRAEAGSLRVAYTAHVQIQHHMASPAHIAQVPLHQLLLEVLPYIYPSRYCQSDRLFNFAQEQFGHLPPGYALAEGICQWVQQHVTFRSNSSVSTTSAVDTLVERVGVCRDYAHLMIALCRAMNLPARFVTGTDYGSPPELGPPDFHAYVEVYLGERWYVFDPSGKAIPMGFMRLATGRDAADVAFATIFGGVVGAQPRIHVVAQVDAAQGWAQPVLTDQALSTA